jgi:hypothetical protein
MATAFPRRLVEDPCLRRFFDPAYRPDYTTSGERLQLRRGRSCKPPGAAGFCRFREILAEHGLRHYFQLCLIAYFQKSALLTLSERLADSRRASPGGAAHAIEDDILRFTHGYWFESLSAQIQDRDLRSLASEPPPQAALPSSPPGVREADAFPRARAAEELPGTRTA